MKIHIKRIYEDAEAGDGIRILVDRLWPRGLSKERAKIDHWAEDIAPSAELRRWYGHDPEKWPEFRARYCAELDSMPHEIEALLMVLKSGPSTFVFSSKEPRLNNAYALREYLESRGDRTPNR